MKTLRFISFFLAFFSCSAGAYELATHGRLTNEAYKRSVLVKDSELLKQLGIEEKPNAFGEFYYDVSGTQVRERRKNDFEESNDRMPREVNPLSIAGWLLRGAIREDDLGEVLGVKIGDDPHDDPYGNIFRVFHHFYDPVFDRPLAVSGQDTRTAPAWGLGTTNANAFTQPNTPESGRRNHFTVFDAREAMYRALTGVRLNNDGTTTVVAPTKSDRDKYWATTFRALGDIVHLIQDMGQPQHTRNDAHSGVPGYGHASIFEAYLECRAIGGLVVSVFSPASAAGAQPRHCTPLDYVGNSPTQPDGYPLPRFTKYADFFSTREGINGRGLADYSNRGFFSAGTNLGTSAGKQYAAPSQDPKAYSKEQVALTTVDEGYQTILAPLHILKGGVPDTLPGGQPAAGVPLTTEGMWYQPLADFSSPANAEADGYTLTRPNYDAQANLLIPRAVAYSAGLIDYFFRGRIEVEDAHFTDAGISLRVRNAIDPDRNPEWKDESLYAQTRSGNPSTLTVTYEYQDEQGVTRHVASNPVALATDPNNSANDDNVAPGAVTKKVYAFTLAVPFVDPNNPRIYKDLKYRLVYRGRLGNEDDAVIAATFRPVSGFLVTTNYAPADGIGGPRMIYRTSTGWRLAPDSGWVAGNIDWKGRYETDSTGTTRPTKVLSWVGPKMRYFPDYERCQSAPFSRCKWVSSSDFNREIFENGEVIATAPANVLGAAITKDINGKDWLVAICMAGTQDVVYRRPYRKGSDAPYDPVNVPNGWKEIGRFDASTLNQGTSRMTHHADIPWFFSGDGRKAQTLRRWWETTSIDFLQKEMRLEINITDDVVLALPPRNHDNLSGYEGIYTCSASYDQYGAGTGQSTSNSSGEYVIAVDYDENGKEILAKIRVTESSTKTSTVKVMHNHQPNEGHSNDVLIGTTLVSGSPYKEDLIWKDGKILPIFSDGRAYDASWGSGPQPSNNYYRRTIDRTTQEKEISYLVDLRYNLYSYYYVNIHSKESIGGGTISYAQDIVEGNEIASNLMPSNISLYSNAWPTYTSSTSPYRIERELNCGSFPNPFITHRYGLSNFGWFLQSPGSGMVDSQGNYAISHPSAADFGYETLAPTNLLSDGKFEDVIKNSPPNAYYYPISVIH